MATEQLHQIIQWWINNLQHYSQADLVTKPAYDSWSAGQLYNHLINDTGYYFNQAEKCFSTATHQNKTAGAAAANMFAQNAFPKERIAGHPSNANIPQPASLAELINALSVLQQRAGSLAASILLQQPLGKTKHPGLGYFSASEWLQFADMHFRHHKVQKIRIDRFLKRSAPIEMEISPT